MVKSVFILYCEWSFDFEAQLVLLH